MAPQARACFVNLRGFPGGPVLGKNHGSKCGPRGALREPPGPPRPAQKRPNDPIDAPPGHGLPTEVPWTRFSPKGLPPGRCNLTSGRPSPTLFDPKSSALAAPALSARWRFQPVMRHRQLVNAGPAVSSSACLCASARSAVAPVLSRSLSLPVMSAAAAEAPLPPSPTGSASGALVAVPAAKPTGKGRGKKRVHIDIDDQIKEANKLAARRPPRPRSGTARGRSSAWCARPASSPPRTWRGLRC